ncbi:MAG: hypothetical protein AAB308_08670, partial [Nitrospirota bacterium]
MTIDKVSSPRLNRRHVLQNLVDVRRAGLLELLPADPFGLYRRVLLLMRCGCAGDYFGLAGERRRGLWGPAPVRGRSRSHVCAAAAHQFSQHQQGR